MTRLRIYRSCPECGHTAARLGAHKVYTQHDVSGATISSWDDPHNYQSAHRLVRAVRGSASKYPCALCGATAYDWSFQGGRDYGEATWSKDIEAYEPLCRKCHWSIDAKDHLEETNAKKSETLSAHRLDPVFDKEYRDSKSRAAVLGNKSPRRKRPPVAS